MPNVVLNGMLNPFGGEDLCRGWMQPEVVPLYLGKAMHKITDMRDPQPSQIWVAMDQSPKSIDDGWLFMLPDPIRQWLEYPAVSHTGANEIAFADGHAETRHWTDPALFNYNMESGFFPQYGSGPDHLWLSLHTVQK